MCDCVRVCSRCKCQVSNDFVTDGYDCACLVHDEDLDWWETELVPKDEVKLFITDDDKKHYRKHGCIREEKLDLLD